ncbi:MAG TPA: peptidoglycan domain protein [Bacteroidetes bacterium]|nr:peptidoglycan domain protein [Bacteroidota bacterium]
MADIKLLAPKILKWEGGFVNDPADTGGATNKGVTLSTWKQVGYDKDGDDDIDVEDIKLLDEADFTVVLRQYWNRWMADKIGNQSVANILVDWVWGSGKWGIVKPQQILGVIADGKVGLQTITALNNQNQKEFFDKIFSSRFKFITDIVDASVQKFQHNIQAVKNNRAQDIIVTPGWNQSHTFEYYLQTFMPYLVTNGEEKALLKFTNKRFLNGWMNRLKDYTFSA